MAIRFGVAVGEGVIVGVDVCVAVAVGSGVLVAARVGVAVGTLGALAHADKNNTSAKAIIRTERKYLCFIFFSFQAGCAISTFSLCVFMTANSI